MDIAVKLAGLLKGYFSGSGRPSSGRCGRLFILLFLFLLLPALVWARPPKVSGNYERGSRYAVAYDDPVLPVPWIEFVEAEELEQESWAYNFHKGHLQVSQILSSRFRYTTRFNWNHKDFPYADINNRNIMRYYRTFCWIGLSRDFDLRLEYYLREQVYEFRPWDNLIHVPSMQIRWNIDRERKRRANLFLRLNAQRYAEESETWKDKNQLSARINYQEEVFERLILKAQYSYVFRRYTDNPDQVSAEKKSISAGFEYQF